jgi:threonine/homoserine/homoserine lactone efflux protein
MWGQTELLEFIGFVLLISLSGVLLPGPMTAATIVRSYTDKWAGLKVSVGHAMVEFPLFVIIAAGSAVFFQQNQNIVLAIGIIGGAYLLYFGTVLLTEKDSFDEKKGGPKIIGSAIVLGITTTLFNPAFILWWVTLGALVITEALTFGAAILVMIWFIHWLTDFGWGIGISFGVQKVKKRYAEQLKKAIRYGCAALILIFGVYFLASSIWTVMGL